MDWHGGQKKTNMHSTEEGNVAAEAIITPDKSIPPPHTLSSLKSNHSASIMCQSLETYRWYCVRYFLSKESEIFLSTIIYS
jgi:hypothetical protein